MLNDEQVYNRLLRMLPDSVPRGLSDSAFEAGEHESAISGLLDEAYSVGALTQKIIDYVESVYTDGPVVEMLEALRMFEEKSGAAG